ncbi:MAG: AI-2E family transporter [Eubacteriales bacterium]|nr:AI-2E family transporter [Eubacteriales bacterium]
MKKEIRTGIAVVAALCGAAAFLAVSGTLVPLLLAGFFAFLLKPLVERTEEKTSRTAAILIVSGIWLSLAVFLIGILLPYFTEQLAQLADTLPRLGEEVRSLTETVGAFLERYGVTLKLEDVFSTEEIAGAVRRLLEYAVSGTAIVAYIAAVPMLCFYLLRDREKLAARLEACLPKRTAEMWKRVGRQLNGELWRYFTGQALLASVVGVCVWAGLASVGVRFPLLLGLIMGLLEFVPCFGAYIGAIPVGITALADGGWQSFAAALAVVFIVEQLEGMFLVPIVIGKNSRLHPGIVLLCLVAGSHLFGAIGLILAVPAAMILRKCVKTIYDEYIRQKNCGFYRKLN